MKIVYTDGSASPNPGPGGFAVIDNETKTPLILGRSKKTTNIVMEGEAMAAAMTAISSLSSVTSSYPAVSISVRSMSPILPSA